MMCSGDGTYVRSRCILSATTDPLRVLSALEPMSTHVRHTWLHHATVIILASSHHFKVQPRDCWQCTEYNVGPGGKQTSRPLACSSPAPIIHGLMDGAGKELGSPQVKIGEDRRPEARESGVRWHSCIVSSQVHLDSQCKCVPSIVIP